MGAELGASPPAGPHPRTRASPLHSRRCCRGRCCSLPRRRSSRCQTTIPVVTRVGPPGAPGDPWKSPGCTTGAEPMRNNCPCRWPHLLYIVCLLCYCHTAQQGLLGQLHNEGRWTMVCRTLHMQAFPSSVACSTSLQNCHGNKKGAVAKCRLQESMAAGSPSKTAASTPPIAAAHVPHTAASPASSPSPTRTAGGAVGAAARSPGPPVSSAAARPAGCRSPAASDGGRSRSRERSLSPEPGALVRNPAHPLHAYSPWSAGLEAYATQLQGSSPQLPGSSHRSHAATPSPGRGSASAARPACRSLRKQFEVSACQTNASHQTPPGTNSPATQQEVETERRSSTVPQPVQAVATPTAATLDGSAARSAPAPRVSAAAAKRAFVGSAGMVLTYSLRACSHAVRGLQSQIWRPVTGATPAFSDKQQLIEGFEGVRTGVLRACEAGWMFQGRIRQGLACLWEACAAEPLLEKGRDRSNPSPAQISESVTLKVTRCQTSPVSDELWHIMSNICPVFEHLFHRLHRP